MKIKYLILWFEDDDMTYQSNRIENYLKDLGFIPCIDKRTSLERAEDINFENYNLILLDFHLNDTKTTEFILDKLQQMDYASEIIFYSDKEKFEDQIKENIKRFEGVFWQHGRQNLVGKIINVIDLTLKKFQDLNNLRGLVMAETADLDKLKKQIFKKYLELNHENKEEFEKELIKKLVETAEDNFKKIKRYQGKNISITETDLTETFDKTTFDLIEDFIFDSDKKSRCIKGLMKLINSEKKFDHNEYREKIIKKRNFLSHSPEEH